MSTERNMRRMTEGGELRSSKKGTSTIKQSNNQTINNILNDEESLLPLECGF